MTSGTSPGGFSNLWKRAITGFVLIIVAIGALFAGGWGFWLLVTLLALAMIAEWAGLMKAPRWKTGIAMLAMLGVMIFAHPLYRIIDVTSLYVLLGACLALALIGSSLRLGGGLLYLGLASLAIIFLREQGGVVLTFWTLAIIWATDIGAYFSGKTIGGPKLAPKFSPNKTWAGLVGGVTCAALVSLIFAFQTVLPLLIVPLAALLAVVAQLGDLFESWMKRRADVKDSSNLFPGHGGALDRLDGLLPVAIGVAALNWAGML
jgi:phosphatidate cytidylyltransferase